MILLPNNVRINPASITSIVPCCDKLDGLQVLRPHVRVYYGEGLQTVIPCKDAKKVARGIARQMEASS